MNAQSDLTFARRIVEFLKFCIAHPETHKQQMPCGCIYRFHLRIDLDGQKAEIESVERCRFHSR